MQWLNEQHTHSVQGGQEVHHFEGKAVADVIIAGKKAQKCLGI